MSNLEIWDRHADINPKFTKPITGKAYKGTSPSPQHVIWCLTDLFGPVGQGWGAEVVAEGFQPLGEEILHWCRIEFWHTDRSNTFQTYGQTKALMQKRDGGFMSDEDAPKKSFTDALVKAASYLGVAANIFLGRWDDAKYVQNLAAEFARDDAAGNAEAENTNTRDRIKAAIQRAADAQTLDALWKHKATTAAVHGLPDDMQAELVKAFTDRMGEVFQAPDKGEHAYG